MKTSEIILSYKNSKKHKHLHTRRHRLWNLISTILHLPGHSHHHDELASDRTLIDNEEGIRTIWLALLILTLTSILQIIIVIWSSSVALFADTVHNVGDGLNSIPLLIAFYLARRAATRRYTYGYAKAEDIAGIFIVLSIAFSAGVIFWKSFQKLLNPEPLTSLGWVAAAAIIGFLGNEAVAMLQIRVGKKIGSAALVADGMHARTDGLTSLAVLLAAGGAWLGFPVADPIIGLIIGVTILFITRNAALAIWYRLMDAIDPEIFGRIETLIQEQAAVKQLVRLRLRWVGHRLHAEVQIATAPQLTTIENHHIIEEMRQELYRNIPNLSDLIVHIDPWTRSQKYSLHHHPKA